MSFFSYHCGLFKCHSCVIYFCIWLYVTWQQAKVFVLKVFYDVHPIFLYIWNRTYFNISNFELDYKMKMKTASENCRWRLPVETAGRNYRWKLQMETASGNCHWKLLLEIAGGNWRRKQPVETAGGNCWLKLPEQSAGAISQCKLLLVKITGIN